MNPAINLKERRKQRKAKEPLEVFERNRAKLDDWDKEFMTRFFKAIDAMDELFAHVGQGWRSSLDHLPPIVLLVWGDIKNQLKKEE